MEEKETLAFWQLSTCKSFEECSDSLEKLWKSMVDKDLYKIYCKEDGKSGRLVLTRNELSDTINFLNTIKYMEGLSK